ncbi:unnamed protein product [Lactuca virosa]|uniref:NB-ARC domain-containing protein n=1 Tax=Lactuca virosa TaxID=75947 RepID=A0AAU9MCL8_9ASTR|nr:unnamed protein product [Lactuca virosa]
MSIHVRNHRRNFEIEVDKGSKWTVNRWKAALTEVADLTGMIASRSEVDFIAKIVDTVKCKQDMKLVCTPARLIGMHSRARFINSWLENEQFGDNVLTICGMGGIGKIDTGPIHLQLKQAKIWK